MKPIEALIRDWSELRQRLGAFQSLRHALDAELLARLEEIGRSAKAAGTKQLWVDFDQERTTHSLFELFQGLERRLAAIEQFVAAIQSIKPALYQAPTAMKKQPFVFLPKEWLN